MERAGITDIPAGINTRSVPSPDGFSFYEVYDTDRLAACGRKFGRYMGMAGECHTIGKWTATFNMTTSDPNAFYLDNFGDAVKVLKSRHG